MKNKALEELVSLHTESLYSWAFHKTSSPTVAEDLVQDTFLAAAEKIAGFKGNSSSKTWLFSILNHKIIDFYRKKTKQQLPFDPQSISAYFEEDGSWQQKKRPKKWDENETHLLDDSDFQAILKMCLDALPEKWNLSVKLKYLMSKKGEEICQELGISTTNYWQMIRRAKLQLRECIENKWAF